MEMFHLAGTAGSNDRNGNRRCNGIDQFDVKSQIGTVAIDAVEQYFPGAQFFADLCQGDRIQIATFPPALDGALVPALLFTTGSRNGCFYNLMPDRFR